MQLTQFTDYSLRALIYLGVTANERSNISDIAAHYAISRSHLVKVITRLNQLGYIHTLRGNNGGVSLKQKPSDINIGDVVQAVEPNFYIVECFDLKKNSCTISTKCKLKHVLHRANKAFLEVLSEYTLADMIANKSELSALLFVPAKS